MVLRSRLRLMQFPYLDAVLKESLRLLPPAGLGTVREAREVSLLFACWFFIEIASIPGSKTLHTWHAAVLQVVFTIQQMTQLEHLELQSNGRYIVQSLHTFILCWLEH